jgi:hypothetical protein
MTKAIRLATDPVRTKTAAAIIADLGAYGAGIGTGMNKPIRMFFLQNLTDQILMFSFNGIDDHMPLASTAYILLDVSSNQSFGQGFYWAEGSRLYVKRMPGGVDPASGSVYLTVFYGAE